MATRFVRRNWPGHGLQIRFTISLSNCSSMGWMHRPATVYRSCTSPPVRTRQGARIHHAHASRAIYAGHPCDSWPMASSFTDIRRPHYPCKRCPFHCRKIRRKVAHCSSAATSGQGKGATAGPAVCLRCGSANLRGSKAMNANHHRRRRYGPTVPRLKTALLS